MFWLGVGMLACASVPAVLWASFGLLLAASVVVLIVSFLLKVVA